MNAMPTNALLSYPPPDCGQCEGRILWCRTCGVVTIGNLSARRHCALPGDGLKQFRYNDARAQFVSPTSQITTSQPMPTIADNYYNHRELMHRHTALTP